MQPIDITQTVLSYWQTSRKTKKAPSGWVSGNAPCCHHRGETADTRGRGGVLVQGDQVRYHCFNCKFTTGWEPGRNFSNKFKNLLEWIGVPDDVIVKLSFQAMHRRDELVEKGEVVALPEFEKKSLPKDSVAIDRATSVSDSLVAVAEYMQSRELFVEDYPFYYVPKGNYSHNLIIPLYNDEQQVGWTARSVDPNAKNRYTKLTQPGYVFNLDRQDHFREFVIVCEGVIDAVYLDCVALLGSEVSDQQAMQINSLGKQVVVVPDRDKAGKLLLEQAIDREWAVSLPAWENDISDIGDAVLRYGRLYTLWSIASAIETSRFKIQLNAKMWF